MISARIKMTTMVLTTRVLSRPIVAKSVKDLGRSRVLPLRKVAGASLVCGLLVPAGRAAAGAASAACSVRRQSPLVAEFEPSIRHDDLRLGQLCPVAVALVWGSQMSTLLRRLAGVTDTIAHLNAQIRELDLARDLVKKARLSARRARRKSRRKRRAC